MPRSKKTAMKSLWLRGETWWFAGTIPGQGRVRRSLGTSDPVEAMIRANKLRDEPWTVENPGASDLDGFIESFQKRGVSRQRQEFARYIIPQVLEEIGVEKPVQLTGPKIQKWLNERPQKVTSSRTGKGNAKTAHDYFWILKRYCQWCVEQHRLPKNPCDSVVPPRLPALRRKDFLLPEQARHCLDSCKNPELKFILYCALHAGLRKAEIIASRPSWFDMQAGLLHVKNEDDFTVKDRDNRTIPLTDEFKEFLKSYGFPAPFMVAPQAKPGAARYRYDFKKRFLNHMKAAGLEGFTFHDLRRTFASLLVSRGISLYKVAKWLGDCTEVVEAHYGHLIPNDDEINAAWVKPAPVNPASQSAAPVAVP